MNSPSDGDQKQRKGRFARALEIFDGVCKWSERITVIYKIVFTVVGVCGGTLVVIYLDKDRVNLDINTLHRCKYGGLDWMQVNMFLPDSLSLEDSAAEMRICDGESLTSRKSKLPAKLAAKYPGCLLFDEKNESLHMRFNLGAVCNDSGKTGTRYLCDGADKAARSAPRNSELATSPADLLKCTEQFFERASKPR